MADQFCLKHRMPDGTIMNGPTHGPDQVCVEWGNHPNEKAKLRRGGRTKPQVQKKVQKKSVGGYLEGPSHEVGGIPAIVGGTTPIELEGTEYIINGKATTALGTQFLDKLNATANDYHPNIQGFQPGELPIPSQYEMGGKLNYQNKNGKAQMRRGGNIPTGAKRVPSQLKEFRDGGSKCPPGMVLRDGACFQISGDPNKNDDGFRNRKGGTIMNKNKSIPKRQTGGMVTDPKRRTPGQRVLRKMKNAQNARKKVGTNTRTSSVDNGHSHILYLDVHGNGTTNAGPNGHTHKVVDNRIVMADGHSHSS
jgi:hypothetical protein